ncbi:MAG: Gfo/Idh/MocA family protein [Aestuariibacter sp.]
MSDNLTNTSVWLIGAGYMAVEYAKVLNALGVDYLVIGNSHSSAEKFEAETGKPVVTGGLSAWLATNPNVPDAVINAVSVPALFDTSMKLLDFGVTNILLEKPAATKLAQLKQMVERAQQHNASIYVAYNRRFYSSVQKALELIELDGGVRSFNFEFTEWSHRIEQQELPEEVAEQWLLCNSSHVIDMAFFMGGWPTQLNSFKEGKLDWHKSGAVFSGAGISTKGALFNYQADWAAPGRWRVEMLTSKHRFYFAPLEKLQVQDLGTIKVYDVDIDDSLDIDYKPGLYRQTNAFLCGNNSHLLTLQEQATHVEHVYLNILKESP